MPNARCDASVNPPKRRMAASDTSNARPNGSSALLVNVSRLTPY